MSGETRGSRGELATHDRPWRYSAHVRMRPVKARWTRASRTRLTLLCLMRYGRLIKDGQPLNRGALMRYQVGVGRWVCRSTRLARCCWSMHADKLAVLALEVGLSGPGDHRSEAQYLPSILMNVVVRVRRPQQAPNGWSLCIVYQLLPVAARGHLPVFDVLVR
jgi:hypothetical protein